MLKVSNMFKKSVEMRSATGYTISTVFSRGLAIITMPIFTRIMTTDQIGMVNIFNSWYSIISVVATLALTSGGFAVAMKEYEGRRDEYQSSVLSLTSLIAVFLSILYFIIPEFWNDIMGMPTKLMLLMLLGFLFAPARDFWLARERYEYRYKLSAVIVIISAILASALSVLVVLYDNNIGNENTAIGRLFANYAVVYGVAAVIWIRILIKGKTFFNREFWKASLSLSLPLVGYNVAAQILNVSDRVMIGHMVNNSAAGIYGTLYTVSSLSLMAWQAINASFIPYLFRNIESKESNIKKIAFGLLLTYSCIAILLSFLAPEIVRILAPEEYYEAIYIMPPIVSGVYFTAVVQLYSNIAVYYKKTKYVMYPAMIAAIINLIFNAICISAFGYMAAAYTTLFSYIIWAMIQVKMANTISMRYGQYENEIYNNKQIVLLSITTVIITLFGLLLYKYTFIRYGFVLIMAIIVLFVGKRYKGIKVKSN